ncbi:hypothetical protein IQ17_06819 [Bradyrhizobium daqingense]|uniref:Uncharacterized protein n=1 Tax=Bradyrhizobium daqingense TaxID=993502 RepID=A0A562KGB9_9BRAD|nr:hypothetical protein IQ17_06819 [Bradyrhizobium daqingense]
MFSVDKIAMTLNVIGLILVTEMNTKLNGADEFARTCGCTTLTEIAAMRMYNTEVIRSVSAMARGTFRCGSFASSTTLARSSKPTKAKNASRLAKVIPERTFTSMGGA